MQVETVFETSGGSIILLQDGDAATVRWQSANGRTEEMLRYDPNESLIRIWPKMPNSSATGSGFQNQYRTVKEFQVDSAVWLDWDPEAPISENDQGEPELHGLPMGFGKIISFGLGLPRKYRGFVRMIEDHSSCTIVRFGDTTAEGADGDTFRVSLQRFATYKHAVDLNRDRGSRVVSRINETETYNTFASLVGLDEKTVAEGRHPIIKAITRAITENSPLDPVDRESLVTEMSAESLAAARENPKKFGKLRDDIELVTLQVLIEQFENGLKGRIARDESKWQEFFEENTFALQQLFAAPMALYGSQLHLRLPNIYGRGGRIADFVLVNSVTRTVFVVEIKTPATMLLGPRYRGSDEAKVFPPHPHLAGAVAQLQGQIESAQGDFRQLVQNSADAAGIDTCVVRGAVIVGTASTLGEEERRSFSRFRNGLNGIEVIAFDEVLNRLKGLQHLLTGDLGPSDPGDS